MVIIQLSQFFLFEISLTLLLTQFLLNAKTYLGKTFHTENVEFLIPYNVPE